MAEEDRHVLEAELATYERELPNLLAKEGKWVLVHGQAVEGIFDTFDDALDAGCERFGLNPFLVKQIFAVEPMVFIGGF